MKKKILLTIIFLSFPLSHIASAQTYSLFEAKSSKEGKQVLGFGQPYLWIGKPNRLNKVISASESESLKYGHKKACQYAAIKAFAELKKKAYKEKYVIVKNIHSPNAKAGLYYCDIGWRSATVELRGTLTNK
ncbi:hypothetical protein [Wohlfahrtiimonas larvae]|uniref:Excinuclease ABC subunit A n=1 Tax=Wohlfahrtiimonas larvae TaxID=1157986 RepID=A0ABP9MDI2_9GAMM|nr:hypothetical protein [Wohlfahrtiimonas larvae]